MAKRQPHTVNLRPIWAEADDVYKGVVRIGKADRGHLKTGKLHKFSCSTGTGRFILRGLSPNEKGNVRLDQDTRDALGVVPGSTAIAFTITEANGWDELAWAWNSTDPGYRVATRLAIFTFILGLVLGPVFGLIDLPNFMQYLHERLASR